MLEHTEDYTTTTSNILVYSDFIEIIMIGNT